MGDQLEQFSERTLSDGGKQRSIYVDPATLPAGADPDADRQLVEQRNSFQRVNTAATTVHKAGKGTLHTLVVGAVGTPGSIVLYNNTAGAGEVIFNLNPAVAGTYIFDCEFSTGLTSVNAGAAAPDFTINWR